jgi:NAD(P)-dependent dehydrogenase (short-subunit alcohol dehydrogenase family)
VLSVADRLHSARLICAQQRPEGVSCRDRLERTFKVNIIAMFSLAQKAVTHMLETGGGGNIINIASIQAYKPSPPILDYSCTKVTRSSLALLLGSTSAHLTSLRAPAMKSASSRPGCLLQAWKIFEQNLASNTRDDGPAAVEESL